MIPTKGLALPIVIILSGALAIAAGSAPGSSSTSVVQLKAISARADGHGTSLVIEATEPVAYVATRPDPLTLLIDFRNVGAEGVANLAAANAKSPIASVTVESVQSLGSPATRVHVSLTQPVDHQVRSDRNTVVVALDKRSAQATPYVLPPTSRQGVDAMAALAPPTQTVPADPIAILARSAPLMALQAPGAAPAASPTLTLALQQPAPAPAEQTAPAPRFSGNPVSLDFQGADLRAVLRTFSEISGLNMVIDPTVQGTVDVALRDVPWDQALDIILRANKLGYAVDGTIIRIAPLTVLAAEEKERSDLSEAQASAGQLNTLTRQLSYAKGDEIVALLRTANVISKRGQAQIEPRTNTLIVTDLQAHLDQVTNLIDTLDKAQPQVEIEARIVQTNKTFARALGVQWGFGARVDPALGNTTNLAFPNNGSLRGGTTATQGVATNAAGVVPTAVNLAVPGASSAVGLALGSINGAFNLDVALSALESSGNGRLLSTPRVSTQNNIAAEITQGVQIPIQTVANNTITVSFKDAALTLKVTPQITAANTVIMQISVENASPDFSRSVNNIPPINTQRANTTVLVSDGQTTVIGGIYASQEQALSDRTPGLSRIPFLNWFFKRDSINDQSSELLIFITPRIIKG